MFGLLKDKLSGFLNKLTAREEKKEETAPAIASPPQPQPEIKQAPIAPAPQPKTAAAAPSPVIPTPAPVVTPKPVATAPKPKAIEARAKKAGAQKIAEPTPESVEAKFAELEKPAHSVSKPAMPIGQYAKMAGAAVEPEKTFVIEDIEKGEEKKEPMMAPPPKEEKKPAPAMPLPELKPLPAPVSSVPEPAYAAPAPAAPAMAAPAPAPAKTEEKKAGWSLWPFGKKTEAKAPEPAPAAPVQAPAPKIITPVDAPKPMPAQAPKPVSAPVAPAMPTMVSPPPKPQPPAIPAIPQMEKEELEMPVAAYVPPQAMQAPKPASKKKEELEPKHEKKAEPGKHAPKHMEPAKSELHSPKSHVKAPAPVEPEAEMAEPVHTDAELERLGKKALSDEEREMKVKMGLGKSVLGFLSPTVTIGEDDVRDLLDELELELLESDVAYEVSAEVTARLRSKLVGAKLPKSEMQHKVQAMLLDVLAEVMESPAAFDFVARVRQLQKPAKVLFIGPNGAGKTTTMAKIARKLQENGMSVVFSASDTFRAAAIEQTEVHAGKLGVPVVKSGYGADPAAVAFDAVKYAKAHKIDV
ncbi:MAG: signal recognition particle receptor subunit alpha, partial [Candidatus Micrarchaeota archaeon]|nr:signal recognition particle receptor subunit alpha [Candidatus Micrarchaeota archaeon]